MHWRLAAHSCLLQLYSKASRWLLGCDMCSFKLIVHSYTNACPVVGAWKLLAYLGFLHDGTAS